MQGVKVQTSLSDELRLVREKLDKIENLLERRLIGEVEPTEDELKATADFDARKKAGRLRFIRLNKAVKELQRE